MANNFELENWLPMEPTKGPPLPRFLNIYWPWYKGKPPPSDGFSLSLMNIPPALEIWNANFAERSFDYEPIADSGWLAWNETWNYPSDPLGCTTLRVWALDADNNILFDVGSKGPIYANRKYAFNCQTLQLWDVTESPGEIIG